MGMALKPRRSPAEGEFLFEMDPEPLEERITALGGVPLLVRAIRSFDVPGSVKRHLHLKQRERGFDEPTYVESTLVLHAVGGECLEDFDRLREDPGLADMLGHPVPSAEAGRKFLYQFHEEAAIQQAQQELPVGQVSYIPTESAPLRALAQVNQELVQHLGRRAPQIQRATIDLDATVIESWKREAKPTYQGGSGYQPMVALWAEMDLIVADEFRDGNVPANKEPLRVAQRAFAALPETVQEYRFRGDSACWEHGLVSWLRNEPREDGPAGFIGFAISVPMHAELLEEIRATPEEQWQLYSEDGGAVKRCAQVQYFPAETPENEYRTPLKYIAIRIEKKQQELFADGAGVKHFAVATNLWDWDVVRLLRWHREKAGTVEAVHAVLKNELAGGVMPCGRFGANAAWFRLTVLTHNVLSGMKRLALPPELREARPKRLRFVVFHTPGKLISHARQLLLRLTQTWLRFSNWQWALAQLPLPAPG